MTARQRARTRPARRDGRARPGTTVTLAVTRLRVPPVQERAAIPRRLALPSGSKVRRRVQPIPLRDQDAQNRQIWPSTMTTRIGRSPVFPLGFDLGGWTHGPWQMASRIGSPAAGSC
jgi:hypothetical protein